MKHGTDWARVMAFCIVPASPPELSEVSTTSQYPGELRNVFLKPLNICNELHNVSFEPRNIPSA